MEIQVKPPQSVESPLQGTAESGKDGRDWSNINNIMPHLDGISHDARPLGGS